MKEKLVATLIDILVKLNWFPPTGNGEVILVWQNHKLVHRDTLIKENL